MLEKGIICAFVMNRVATKGFGSPVEVVFFFFRNDSSRRN